MGNAFLAGQGGGGMSDKKIKEYLNSTVGTNREMPLDKLISYYVALDSGTNRIEYTTPGVYTVTVPVWASYARITACAGGGGGGSGYYHGGGGGGGRSDSSYSAGHGGNGYLKLEWLFKKE